MPFKGLKLPEHIIKSHTSHPFAHFWESLNQDIENSKIVGSLQLSELSLRSLNLLNDLELIKNVPNYERIIKDIRNKSKFYSACFEASIVASYCSKGFEVEILEESAKKGIRTCDFIAKNANGKVSVECKSLDDISIEEKVHWDELKYRLAKYLDDNKKSWKIDIIANKPVRGNEKEFLFKEISKDIKNNDLMKKELSDNDFIVEYMKIAKWDQFFPLPLSINKSSENGFIEGEFHNGLNIYKNLRIIEIWPYKEHEISKRLISNFKSAVGQIPKNGPGIVHIGVPYKIGDYLLQIIDNSYDSLFEKLNKDSNRVNAVVISGIILENNINMPLLPQYYIVPNMITQSQLPSKFSIVGANNQIHEDNIINNDEGTIEFEFKLSKNLDENAHLLLFDYSTKDGKYQLKIWFTWTNKFRMDIITPSLGRVFIETDEFKPNLNSIYKYAGTWSKKDISIYVNGKRICKKELF